MANVTVYLKCDRNVQVMVEDVYLKDLGSLRCMDSVVSAKLKAIKVHRFHKNSIKRHIVSVTKLIELMETACENIQVEVVGEADVLIEQVKVDQYKGWKQIAKIILVSLVSFFGTAFTIIAYHNDIGIHEVFAQIYTIFMNREPGSINILEVSYSIGLGGGIILFFNHIGGRRITKDPTPIEVAMRNYEVDVDNTLVELASREGKEAE